MQTREMKHIFGEMIRFINSDENMHALEELTASLKNALASYEVEGETPNGIPLYDTFCDSYNQLFEKALIAIYDTENMSLRPSDLTMLVQLAEYGARRGNRLGAAALGSFYLLGAGVTQSLHQALYFLQLAANLSQCCIVSDEYMQKDPDGSFQTLLEATSGTDVLEGLTETERKELLSKALDNLYTPLKKAELQIEHSAQFNAVYMATTIQMYITMQPHTPNLTLNFSSGNRKEDYIAVPTEYIALLNRKLATEKKNGNPTIPGEFEKYMQGLRNCLKYPFPEECRKLAHNELYFANKPGAQYAMSHWQAAVDYYLCAAMQGDAEAAAGIGYCCEHVPGSSNTTYRYLAMQWYQHAAKAGSAWAMNRVGLFYDQGLCGPIDHEMANRCFALAREMGMPAQA